MYSRPNLSVTPGISWLPTFAFQSTILKRTSFFGVLVLESLVGLHRTIQLKLLQHYWSGHRLGFLWYWMVFLGNEERSFCHFWDCIQVPWTTFPLFYHWTLALKTLLFSLCLGKNPTHFSRDSSNTFLWNFPQLLQSELVTPCFYWP